MKGAELRGRRVENEQNEECRVEKSAEFRVLGLGPRSFGLSVDPCRQILYLRHYIYIYIYIHTYICICIYTYIYLCIPYFHIMYFDLFLL